MYEKLAQCPSCGHPKFTNHIICEDYANTKESFALVKCAKCELVFTNPRPSQQEIGKYYDFPEYHSHSSKSFSLFNTAYSIARNINLSSKIKILHQYQKTGTLLDYGCGTGDFMAYASKKGFSTIGVEPNDGARNTALQQTGSVVLKDIGEIKGKENKFNIITAWHVVEHIHDLRDTLKAIKKRLHKDGYLIIAVPNIASADCEHYGSQWAAYDVPRHLYHFSRTSMHKLATSIKLKQLAVYPMKLDAYYVSLLSEKYQNSTGNPIKAFTQARKSNIQAKSTGEYSSLIYVFQK